MRSCAASASRRAATAPRVRMRGGTFLGFLFGMMFGLGVAVVVALMVTKGPVPFMNKAGRAPDRVGDLRPQAEPPDPNRPLYSKNRPMPSAPDEQPVEPEDKGVSLLDRLFGRRAPDAAPETDPQKPAARAGGSPEADAERSSYLLQAGAFRTHDDADAMRARLALLGFEARIVSTDANGQTLHRVRVGPFTQLDDANKARARLADNGIEASVSRSR